LFEVFKTLYANPGYYRGFLFPVVVKRHTKRFAWIITGKYYQMKILLINKTKNKTMMSETFDKTPSRRRALLSATHAYTG
jgi:hypothetical protein